MYHHKRSAGTSARYVYHCCQNKTRQRSSRKSKDMSTQHRDKIMMDSFDCDGWVHISIWDLTDIARIKIRHSNAHVPYYSINIPQHITEYVSNNCELSMSKVSDSFLFRQQSVTSIGRSGKKFSSRFPALLSLERRSIMFGYGLVVQNGRGTRIR